MSAGGAFGGNRGLRPVPPEKGIFPLDHMHECDSEKQDYLHCLKSSSHQSEKCRQFSKKYLECRMAKKSYVMKGESRVEKNAKTNVTKLRKFYRIFHDKQKHRHLFNRRVSLSSVFPLRALPSMPSFEATDTLSKVSSGSKVGYNRVDCLVWVLHEAARSFSCEAESLGLQGSGVELAMAWNGKDVNEWHKRIAYLVAVYTLLKTTAEVEILLSHDRQSNSSSASTILTPKINSLDEHIENQLNKKHSGLVEWFRQVELPRLAGFFTSLLKIWSAEYAGSGVAGIVLAITCCSAVGKLISGKICCYSFTMSMDDVLVKLMDLSHSLVAIKTFHKLATEAGFERNFLCHFGAKILPCNRTEEVEFWTGLAQQKLSLAFHAELVNGCIEIEPCDIETAAHRLATLGLFAYLGRKTRLFLSQMSMNDLDELIKDFITYLECGIVYVYSQLSTVSSYEWFMDIVQDEIGWLDFYALSDYQKSQGKKRRKPYPTQAEKEMILSLVYTICYDVFSGFTHFSRSTQHPFDTRSLGFLLRSQSLLSVCLEDYRAIYDKSREPMKMAETGGTDYEQSAKIKGIVMFPMEEEVQKRKNRSIFKQGIKSTSLKSIKLKLEKVTSSPVQKRFIKKYKKKLVSQSNDAWTGAQLLRTDIAEAVELLLKQLHGYRFTNWERKKFRRTLNDIAALIPVTILMLLPVSAIGHAAILASIKRYMPFLIPSPFSTERLDVLKQLNRIKMESGSWSNHEDPISTTV